jgi:hypothetical protein
MHDLSNGIERLTWGRIGTSNGKFTERHFICHPALAGGEADRPGPWKSVWYNFDEGMIAKPIHARQGTREHIARDKDSVSGLSAECSAGGLPRVSPERIWFQ